jgi:Skp family chaperone for outer membrane proteins
MKIKLFGLLILPLLLGESAWAQTPRPGTPATPAPAASGPVPVAKIALLDLSAFREGIGELKQKYEKLAAEFEPRAKELESIQAKLAAQEKVDTSKMTPPQIKKLSEDYEQLKKEFERKREDYQELARRREAEETAPIYEKVNDLLEKYAAQRGITMVFELTVMEQGRLLLFASNALDITDDFMKEYNKAHPVPAATAATPRRPPPR